MSETIRLLLADDQALVRGALAALLALEPDLEVLSVALRGGTVAAIAGFVHLSQGTVRNHLSPAIGKTGTSTRAEAARVAQDRGWL